MSVFVIDVDIAFPSRQIDQGIVIQKNTNPLDSPALWPLKSDTLRRLDYTFLITIPRLFWFTFYTFSNLYWIHHPKLDDIITCLSSNPEKRRAEN